MSDQVRRVSIVLFDGFELLDVFGPVELLSVVGDRVRVELVGPQEGLVRSSQGTRVEATSAYATAEAPDVVLVPGGRGTRALVEDAPFLAWLAAWAAPAALVTSVCTGSAVLAAAGLLDGYRATSNKAAFRWAAQHGADVAWVAAARWVEDRDRWTSSGVAAGMDMAHALLARLLGPDAADLAATVAELDVHRDPAWDPFARVHGLVDEPPAVS
ncbi:DJ-1/PfpI family protein [Xylanimonas protaetiae]|uniref:DJ-1/PfpI family protein n=1 Tax=Xylanimonas protaetiae TaxID=2509457 RepID=A0A4P6F5C3_9MICO|nr:DJ-1/PfpI family protein [Xylanimonas protaetiae]QAY71160.1 DJ-1/PfpI family protein [Xylanimonas protaetiae]